jgi:hypothetical protein
MEILNFKQFLKEAEDKNSSKGADAIGAMTSFLGIMPEDVPEVLSKDKKLVVNKLIKRKFPLEIAITPVSSEPKFANGKLVGADIKITPEEDEPFSYVYLNKSLNKNRLRSITTSISPNSYKDILTTGLQPK